MMGLNRNTLSIRVKNQPGTLLKVTAVISGRGLNIHEMTVRVSDDQAYTWIMVDFLGEKEKLRLVKGQLEKLEVVEQIELVAEQ